MIKKHNNWILWEISKIKARIQIPKRSLSIKLEKKLSLDKPLMQFSVQQIQQTFIWKKKHYPLITTKISKTIKYRYFQV